MFRLNVFFLVFQFVFLFSQAVFAQAETPSENANSSEFGGSISVDVKGSLFYTSDDDDGDQGVGHALDYQPEVIPTQAIQAQGLFKGRPFFSLRIEAPMGGDADTAGTLELSEKDSGIEKIETWLDLLFTGNDNLSLLRFDFKRHVFVGNAIGQENGSRYIAADGTTTILNIGDQIRFRSEFEEFSVTVPFAQDGGRRWGVYRSVATKPHETTLSGQVVLETEITGLGAKFMNISNNFTSEINIGMVDFSAPQGDFDVSGFDFSYHGEWHPHFYLIGSEQSYTSRSKNTIVLVPLVGIQFNFQMAESPANADPGDETGELSMDIIIDAGIKLEVVF